VGSLRRAAHDFPRIRGHMDGFLGLDGSNEANRHCWTGASPCGFADEVEAALDYGADVPDRPDKLKLPKPHRNGGPTFEACVSRRRSAPGFRDRALAASEIGLLL